MVNICVYKFILLYTISKQVPRYNTFNTTFSSNILKKFNVKKKI